MKIQGIEGMSIEQVRFEVQRGGKFVFYHYCISIVVMTFRRSSPVHFIPAGHSSFGKGLPWTFLTLVMGWWGIPWGPIFSVQSLIVNFQGGKDVTKEVMAMLQPAQAAAAAAGRG